MGNQDKKAAAAREKQLAKEKEEQEEILAKAQKDADAAEKKAQQEKEEADTAAAEAEEKRRTQVNARNAGVDRDEETGLPVIPSDNPSLAEPPAVQVYNGIYTKLDDGLPYALRVELTDPRGNTHKLKNTAKFWEGNRAQFLAQFEKVSD